MFKKALCIILSFIITFCFASCGKSEYDLWDYSTATVLSDNDRESIKQYLTEITFYDAYSMRDNLLAYECETEVLYVADIGLKGIPVLLDTMKTVYEDQREVLNDLWLKQQVDHPAGVYLEIFSLGIYQILHCSKFYCFNYNQDHASFERNPGHHKIGFKERNTCFFLTAEAEIPEILESDTDISAKFPKLARFGILAIPYILPEIESGKTEYEDYFTYIGLHLSNEDFIKTSISIHYEERWEELQQDENYTKGSEDFDYKKWLDENANDIRALLKYIDEYTEEFKDLA